MTVALKYPYVTLDDVKAYCGIATTETEYDDDIRRFINKASRLIDSLTGRFFYKKTLTDYYLSGQKDFEGWRIVQTDDGRGYLIAPQMAPIISVTSIVESGVSLSENVDYFIRNSDGIIERICLWSETPRAIKITCEIGYDSDTDAEPSDDIPGDIAQYAMELASRFSGRYKKSIKNYASGGAESVDLFGIPKEIEKALRDMRPVILG